MIDIILEEVLEKYSKDIIELPTIKIKLLSKDDFVADALNNSLNQLLIQQGMFKDFYNEFPTFASVYNIDKHPTHYAIVGCYYITICEEIANRVLEPFNTVERIEYIKHVLAHEITHIVEDSILKNKPELWETIKSSISEYKDTIYNEVISKEYLAEYIASKFSNKSVYKKVEEAIWSPLLQRMRGV